MAHSTNNIITRTYSGKFGDTCMQRDGILRSRPDMSGRVLSERQKQHLSRFESAKEYARQVKADAEKIAFYTKHLKRWKKKKHNVGVYQLAIMDFMHPPRICRATQVESSYGNPHSVKIETFGEFCTTGATVRLIARDGAILEEGEAKETIYSVCYEYVIQDPLLAKQAAIIRVRSWGMPGIAAEKDFPWVCRKAP